ncbi:flagellar assembly protein FliX [Govanella unica]|uniref:Flagellar assembly protein FliX n=1 Tax=Govanella unica TaxID=2975056 RepID=A0A9X3TWU3_9PROT|nr:flagellar assembly protein FliX [Govania unica]
MKISGTGQVGKSSGATRKKGVPGDSDSFGSMVDSDVSSLAAAGSSAGVGPLAAVGGLFALQEAPDATAGRSKGVGRAEDMLKQLDEVKRALLFGEIPVNVLKSLAYSVRQQRAQTDDPRLNDILAEIELRAEVELAKLGF